MRQIKPAQLAFGRTLVAYLLTYLHFPAEWSKFKARILNFRIGDPLLVRNCAVVEMLTMGFNSMTVEFSKRSKIHASVSNVSKSTGSRLEDTMLIQ